MPAADRISTSISPRGNSIRNELGTVNFRDAAEIAVLRRADLKLLLRPRNAHEKQPPLLFQLVGRRLAPLVRQESLFHGHDVNHRELQPLRGVQRHQRDAVQRGLPIVGVVDQARSLPKTPPAGRGRAWRSSNSRATVSNSSMLASRSSSSGSGEASPLLLVGRLA